MDLWVWFAVFRLHSSLIFMEAQPFHSFFSFGLWPLSQDICWKISMASPWSLDMLTYPLQDPLWFCQPLLHLPTPTAPLRNSALLFPCHAEVVGTLYPHCTNTYWSNCPSLFLLWCLGSWMNIRQICWGGGYQTLLKDSLHLIKFHSSLVIYFSLLGPHKWVLHHFTLSSTPWFLQCTLAPKDTTLCVMGKTNFLDCILTFP